MRGLILSLTVMLFALPAAAQELWRYNPDHDGEIQALNCPINDGASGKYLCLILGCVKGERLRWRLAAAGAELPDRLRVGVSVDGALAGTLDLSRVPSDIPLDYTAAFDPGAHEALVAALRTGARAQLALEAGADRFTYPLSLSGSSAALSMAMRQCPAPSAPADDPVATQEAAARDMCAQMDGTLTLGDGFATRLDLNDDGQEDIIIDLGAARCSTSASLFCGSGGCSHVLYLATDQGYRVAWDDTLHEVINEPGPTATVMVHGSACDEVGVVPCAMRIDLSGDQGEVMERISGDAALEWRDTLKEALADMAPQPAVPAEVTGTVDEAVPMSRDRSETGGFFTRQNANK